MMIIHFKFETFFWHMRASQALISLRIAQAGLGLCGLLVYSTVAPLLADRRRSDGTNSKPDS